MRNPVGVLFVILALPGFVLLCAAIAALFLRRTRRFAPYLSAPGAILSGTAQILAGATGMITGWHVVVGACFAAIGAVNVTGLAIERHLRRDVTRRWGPL